MDEEERNSQQKYLAITNWEKYQVIQHGKSAPWCRLYSSILDDEKWMDYTWAVRGVFVSLIALRTRLGHNLPNDPVKLRRMLGGDPVQASVVHRSLSVLLSDGFLVLTNQQNGHENSRLTPAQSRVEESRVEKNPPIVHIPPLDIKPKSTKKNFIPPTKEELRSYVSEQGITDPEGMASSFMDHYTANGWKVGRNPMKDWKAAVRYWKHNDFRGNGNGNHSRKTTAEQIEEEYARRESLFGQNT